MKKVRQLTVLTCAVLITLAGTSGGWAQAKRAMTLVDLLEVPVLSEPQLSPNGRQVLYVLARADWKPNKRLSHIFRVNVDGSETVQMTNGPEGEASPRWSPDGREIAFLRKTGQEEEAQIYVMSNEGGEARPLSKHLTSVSNISWSPDGSALYFLAADPKTEEEKEREKAKDDVFAFDENYKQQHLWKISVAEQVEQRITEGDYSVSDYQLSRDGRSVAFHRAPNPLYGYADQGEVWVMDADGRNGRQLTRNTVSEEGAQLSPDGREVLFLARANQQFETYYNDNLFVAPAGGGEARVLLPDLPYEVERAGWSKEGKSIFFVANMGVHSELFELELASKKLLQLTEGKHAIRSWHHEPKTGQHVFSLDQPTNAGDLWALPAAGGDRPQPVTHVFDHLARDFVLPRQEKMEWKGADGATVEGLLFYPLDYQQGKRYPLVVQTHGGPAASDKFGFGRWGNYVPVLAAKGYAVLQPNYRGSTGYGNGFLRDMVGHYFENSHLDVMAGVDHLIQMGIADGSRLVKMGWSGGGHMTNKIITFTDRFKAASSGAGAVNWISMYAQSDVRTYRTPWFGGTPWQRGAPIDLFWEHSPLKHIASVKTPTVILVGEKDVRVPPPQSVELYRALKANGVATRLYIAPREPHGWWELRHQLFKMNVELDWFEKYAMGRKYTWEKAPVPAGSGPSRAPTQP